MNDDKYDRITKLIKQIGQLIVNLKLDEMHTHQKIEQLDFLIQELESLRAHYESEQNKLFWQEPPKEEQDSDVIDSDAA